MEVVGDAEDRADLFFGMDLDETKHIFGKDAYMRRYGNCGEDGPDLHAQPQSIFEDWLLTVPFAEEAIDIVCCPEDQHCEEGCEKHRRCCPKCELPVCRECERAMRQRGTAAMPTAALVNDLMIFDAPHELYTKRVTVI